jgi:hypothetical protein
MQCNRLVPLFAVALFFSWWLSGGDSAAEVRLSGMQDRVVIQANDATVEEVLVALRKAFGLEVTLRGTIAQKFTGEYSGSVHNILRRLLTGEDYILQTTSGGIRIVLLAQSASDNEARPGLLTLPRPRPPAPQVAEPCKSGTGEARC